MDTETIMNFLADNYKWFMIGAGVLLLALIGFIVGGKKKKDSPDTGIAMNQTDFNQMGTMQQATTTAQPAPQFIQNPAPVQQAAPVVAQTTPQEPVAPVQAAAPESDTIFTGAPTNTSEPEEEKLVIEAPTGTLNENINMDSIGSERGQEVLPPVTDAPAAPAASNQMVFETPPVEAPVAPAMESVAPEMAAAPAPVMEAQPVMGSVAQEADLPISMEPEAPVMQTPPTPVVQEVAPVQQAPVEAAPMYQNTIQQ